MSETDYQMSEQEAQEKIASAFRTLDLIYLLHAPEDQTVDAWVCKNCKVAWPCETEALILEGLGLISSETSESESPSA
jgi:hypothetical protein